MNSGCYFFYDTDSDEAENVQIFRYRNFVLKANVLQQQQLASTPQYPIYLVITDEDIIFYFDGIDSNLEKPKQNHAEQDDGSAQPSHRNDEIMRLPLTSFLRSHLSLENILHEIIQGSYSICKRHYEVSNQAFYHSVLEEKPWSENEAMESIAGFNNLEKNIGIAPVNRIVDGKKNLAFQLHDDGKYTLLNRTLKHEQALIQDAPPEKYILLKRELLLDFLFDLGHSAVFHIYPGWEDAEKTLRENPTLRAIVAKFEYYYCRANYLKAQAAFMRSKEDNSLKNYVQEWSDQLQEAEEDWLEILTTGEETDRLFYNSHGWFFPAENELRGVVFADPINRDWLVRLLWWAFPTNKQQPPCFNRYDWLNERIKYFQKSNNIDRCKIEESYFRRTRDAFYTTFLRRFSLTQCYRLLPWSTHWFVFITLFCVYALIADSFWASILTFVIATNLLFPALIFTLDTLKEQVYDKFIVKEKANFDFRYKAFHLSMILPKITLSIIVGWFVFIMGQEIWGIELTLSVRSTVIIITGLSMIAVSVIYYSIRTVADDTKALSVILKSIFFYWSTLILSISYGMFIMANVGPRIIDQPGSYFKGNTYIDQQYTQINALQSSIEQLHTLMPFPNDSTERVRYFEAALAAVDKDRLWRITDENDYPARFADSMAQHPDAFKQANFREQMEREKYQLILSLEQAKDSLVGYMSDIEPMLMDAARFEELSAAKTKAKNWDIPILKIIHPPPSSQMLIFPRMLVANGIIVLFFALFAQLAIQDKNVRQPY